MGHVEVAHLQAGERTLGDAGENAVDPFLGATNCLRLLAIDEVSFWEQQFQGVDTVVGVLADCVLQLGGVRDGVLKNVLKGAVWVLSGLSKVVVEVLASCINLGVGQSAAGSATSVLEQVTRHVVS